jgi:hypothetical protein
LENIAVTIKAMRIRFQQNILDNYFENVWV